jgi:hypothetical protein
MGAAIMSLYLIQDRPAGAWRRAERFTADDDAEALAVFEGELMRDPATERRLLEEWTIDGISCGRVIREHVAE